MEAQIARPAAAIRRVTA